MEGKQTLKLLNFSSHPKGIIWYKWKLLDVATMKNYEQYALKILKDTGCKITKQRRMVVELLARTDKALSPYDMRDTLKKQKIAADVVTIYRILETLEKLSLAHKVLALNGYIRCNMEEVGKGKIFCHHYLLCRSCHRVDEVEGEGLAKFEQRIEKTKYFSVDSHYLEFTGLCRYCRNKSKK